MSGYNGDPDWAYCADPEREHYDHEFNAYYDCRDDYDMTDWCGLAVDADPGDCDIFDDCIEDPFEPGCDDYNDCDDVPF